MRHCHPPPPHVVFELYVGVALHQPHGKLPDEDDDVPFPSSLLAVHAEGLQSLPVVHPLHALNVTGEVSSHSL